MLVGLRPPAPGAIPWVVLLAAFALTEMFPVHLEHRREAVTLSLSTIPLVVGLFTVAPIQLIVARVLGSGLVFTLHRRQRPYKLALNLTLFALDSAVAGVVFHTVAPGADIGLRSWPGAFAAALCADLVATIVLVLAISLFQGQLESGVVHSTLVRALEERFEVADVTVSVGASIGIAIAPLHGMDASKLLQLADVAMYTAKADQSNVEVYHEGRQHRIVTRPRQRPARGDRATRHRGPRSAPDRPRHRASTRVRGAGSMGSRRPRARRSRRVRRHRGARRTDPVAHHARASAGAGSVR